MSRLFATNEGSVSTASVQPPHDNRIQRRSTDMIIAYDEAVLLAPHHHGGMMNQTGEDSIKSWARDWTSGDLTHLLSLFTNDCVYEDVAFGAAHRGTGELKRFAEGIRAPFPDFHARVDNVLSDCHLGCGHLGG